MTRGLAILLAVTLIPPVLVIAALSASSGTDFITPTLNRSADAWDGLHVPDSLKDLAEQTWTAASVLVATPYDEAGLSELDRLRAAYADFYATSAAIASDEKKAAVLAEQLKLQERLDTKNKRIEKLRAEVRQLRGDGDSQGATG